MLLTARGDVKKEATAEHLLIHHDFNFKRHKSVSFRLDVLSLLFQHVPLRTILDLMIRAERLSFPSCVALDMPP